MANILISSLDELALIGVDEEYPIDGDYLLTQDLDASETISWDDGKGWTPICPIWNVDYFSGTFNGNYHTISNLYINRPGLVNSTVIALFGLVSGTIKNLRLDDAVITGSAAVGSIAGVVAGDGLISNCHSVNVSITCQNDVAGGLVGGLGGFSSGGTVSYCNASGTVYGSTDGSSFYNFGGLVGFVGLVDPEPYADGSFIENSWAEVDISADPTSTLIECGGLVGINLEDGTISDCYSTGDITGESTLGGFVGTNNGTINRCYSIGAVAGNSILGGFCASDGGIGIANDCFWDTTTSGQATSQGGTGKTTNLMQFIATYTNWDFVNFWYMDENDDYPRFFLPSIKVGTEFYFKNKLTQKLNRIFEKIDFGTLTRTEFQNHKEVFFLYFSGLIDLEYNPQPHFTDVNDLFSKVLARTGANITWPLNGALITTVYPEKYLGDTLCNLFPFYSGLFSIPNYSYLPLRRNDLFHYYLNLLECFVNEIVHKKRQFRIDENTRKYEIDDYSNDPIILSKVYEEHYLQSE